MRYDRSMIHEGMVVYSRGGEKLGKVAQCGATQFLVEKGLFFKKDFVAPYDQIFSIEGDDLVIEGDLQAWEDQGYRRDEYVPERRADLGGETSERRMQLAEEELTAEKRVKEAGAVKLHKEVRTENKQITVPVMHEEVKVERVPASGQPITDESRFAKDETLSVPVREEEVEVRKRPVVREEVRVTKRPVVEERRLDATTRREEVDIDDSTAKTRVDRDLSDIDSGYDPDKKL